MLTTLAVQSIEPDQWQNQAASLPTMLKQLSFEEADLIWKDMLTTLGCSINSARPVAAQRA